MAFLIVTEKNKTLYEVSMQQPAVKGAAAVIILLGDLTAYTVLMQMKSVLKLSHKER